LRFNGSLALTRRTFPATREHTKSPDSPLAIQHSAGEGADVFRLFIPPEQLGEVESNQRTARTYAIGVVNLA
jgi:hypothetical protein